MSLDGAALDFSSTDNLRERLREYRRNEKFTDVILKVGELEFPAHRIILEDSSPVLKVSFSDNWSKSNVVELDKEFVDPEVVEELLDFFYTAKLTLKPDNVYSICIASHFLNIANLLKSSEEYLCRLISILNVFDLFLFSQKLDLKNLQKGCVIFVRENCTMLVKESKLASLNEDHFGLLIREMSALQFDAKVKETLFEMVITWIGNDLFRRSPLLRDLLESIPLAELSQTFLCENVTKQNVIRSSFECSSLLIDALSAPRIQKSSNLICFGGHTRPNSYGAYLYDFSCLQTSTGKWSNSNTPNHYNNSVRTAFGSAVIGRRVYFFGGKSNRQPEPIEKVTVFDWANNSWKDLQNMPYALAHCAAAPLNGFLYVTGGQAYQTGMHIVKTSLLKYCPENDKWERMEPMLAKRKCHQLVELNGLLYAIGGQATKTAEVYNPEEGEWRMIAEPKFQHELFGATAHYGKIYVCSDKGFEVYCPYSNSWTTLTPLNSYIARCLVSINGKLWSVGGGNTNNSETKSIFEFDLSTKIWTPKADMDLARQYHCSFVINSSI